MLYLYFSKTVEVQIVDREEYEKSKMFSVVLGEPKIVRCEEAHISNLDQIEDVEIRKILAAGKPALGNIMYLYTVNLVPRASYLSAFPISKR